MTRRGRARFAGMTTRVRTAPATARPRRAPRRRPHRRRGRTRSRVSGALASDHRPARAVAGGQSDRRSSLHLRRPRRVRPHQNHCAAGRTAVSEGGRAARRAARHDQSPSRHRLRTDQGTSPLACVPVYRGANPAGERRRQPSQPGPRTPGRRTSCAGIHKRTPNATRRGRRARRSRCSTLRRSSRPRARGWATRTPAPFKETSARACASLRPRAGRSRWRPIYRRVSQSTFVILAVAPEAAIDSRGFEDAVARAVARFVDLKAD